MLLALFTALGNDATRIEVQPGHSVVLELSADHRLALVTAPKTARAVALDGRTLMIQGVALGTTDLTVTYPGSQRVDQWDIAVTRDAVPLKARVDEVCAPTPVSRH